MHDPGTEVVGAVRRWLILGWWLARAKWHRWARRGA
jgi:hypothetical protein